MFTVREAFGLAVGALVVWTASYSVFFTGRRYPVWLVPGQGDNGGQVAALNLSAIVAALATGTGSGAGWFVSSVGDLPLDARSVITTSFAVGLLALLLLVPAARRVWPEHAARIDAARERRMAYGGRE